MRRIIIGASRDIEYDIRNDFFARLEQQPLAYYQARRTGDLMSRATNDLNAVRMMIGPAIMYSANTVLVFVDRNRADADDRRAPHADRADAAAVCDRRGALLRVRDTPPLRADPGAAVRHQRRRAGSAVGRACRPRLPAGGARDRALPPLQRGIPPSQPRADPAAGGVLSEHDVLHRARLAAGAVDGQPRGDSRQHHPRRVRRLQRLSRDAQLADDRVRLGHQHPAARPGVVGPHARSPRARAVDQRRRRYRARPRRAARRRDRDPPPHVHLSRQRAAGAARREPAHRGRTDRGVGRRDRLGQVDADSLLPRLHEPPPGTVTIGGVDIREIPLARLRGAIGFVPQEPFLFSTRSPGTSPLAETQESAETGERSRRRRGGGASRQGRRRLPARATTRPSASGASRSRAARSSARRWRARCSSIRRS